MGWLNFGFELGRSFGILPSMTTQVKELTKQALALPAAERREMAETLFTSVDGFYATPEVEAAWEA
ncbi:MAG: hypothetical protein ABUL65_00240, partial [Opitutus sp.]